MKHLKLAWLFVAFLAPTACDGGDDDDTTGADAAAAMPDGAVAMPDGAPATPDAPPAGGPKVGDPCTTADDCPAGGTGTTVCLTDGFPGGYCAVMDCGDHSHDCPDDPGQTTTTTEGAKCVKTPANFCAQLCASNADCREGYACLPQGDTAGHGTVDVCWPM